MKPMVIIAAAGLAAIAVSPAIAQSQAGGHMAMQPMTRAAIVQMVQQHFATLDTDRDGYLTKAEMEAGKSAMHERMQARKDERGAKMFDRMDSNHDGSITRQEFDAAHQAMAGRIAGQGGKRMHAMGIMHGAGMGERMFETADVNKDGRVSLQEATNAATAHFDRADTNHDGTVTPDEMRAAHKTMRGKQAR